jgi:sarcosine oxidase subunit alpha
MTELAMSAPANRRLDRAAPAAQIAFSFNGKALSGRAGDSIASALLAAGVDIFSRSLKYHRPRGPFCLAGRCSHCLVRVDGRPDVVACMTPLMAGMQVVAQNAFPSAEHDVLSAIDWLFPKGLDHHALFAGVPLVESAAAAAARHIAGLGPLPDRIGPPGMAIPRRDCDLAIVGAGPAGLALAQALRRPDLAVELVEERPRVGGRLASGLDVEPGDPDLAWAERAAAECRAAGVRLSLGTAVIAAYREAEGRLLLLRSDEPPRLALLAARRIAFCNGAVEPLWPFVSNDRPGIFAGRGLARLLREQRVLPGERAVVVGSGYAALALSRLLRQSGAALEALVDPSGMLEASDVRLLGGCRPVRVEGHQKVHAIEVGDSQGRVERLECDLVALVGPIAPAVELALQAGAAVAFAEAQGGYYVRATAGETAAESIHAAGDVTGGAGAGEARAAGEALGRALAARLP